jgi:lysophospholipase L1-like esterase
LSKAPRARALIGCTFCLAAVAALVVLSASRCLAEEAQPKPHQHPYHLFRLQVFELSTLKVAAIVMLGDSITEAGPWEELTGCRALANRGIGGDTTGGVLARLDGVVKLKPRAVFLMIGVNDVTLGVAPGQTIANYQAILDRLAAANVHTFATFVLPVARSYGKPRVNAAITQLDEAIATSLRGRPQVTALDLRPQMRAGDGFLREELTYDLLHLTAKGYAIWRDAIAPQIAEYCGP